MKKRAKREITPFSTSQLFCRQILFTTVVYAARVHDLTGIAHARGPRTPQRVHHSVSVNQSRCETLLLVLNSSWMSWRFSPGVAAGQLLQPPPQLWGALVLRNVRQTRRPNSAAAMATQAIVSPICQLWSMIFVLTHAFPV
jgi:hypothetical protein